MTRTTLGILVFGFMVFLVGVGLVLSQERFRKPPKFSGATIDLLPGPADLSGWEVKHTPIADTPEMQKRVLDILDYDDAAYVIYQKGELRVSVYLAYWKPGKVSPRSVARHTPDVCWTLAGWNCTKREEFESFQMGGLKGRHTEYRSFTIGDQTEHVVFWHIFGEEIVSYHTGWRPPWYATITDFLRWGNQQKLEQFFLRVSSNRPLEEFRNSAPLLQVVGRFQQISRQP